VAVGEPFWVSITVEGMAAGIMVSLPPGSPFELLHQGGMSSFSFSFGGSSQRSQQTFRWQVRALRPGRQTLGPLVVTIGGQQYRAGTADFDVLAGSAQPPPTTQPPVAQPGTPAPAQPQQNPQQNQGAQSIPEQIEASDLSGAIYDNEMFLRTVVEPAEAYVGQQVVMTVYLYRRIRLDQYTMSREPSTEGFWVEDIGRQEGELRQFVGQTMFVVNELKRSALFPLREGSLTIGAPRIEGRTGFSLFSRRANAVVRDGVPVEVKVLPLPTKGRPDAFEPGNVGRFTIQGALDKRSTKVGEPVTLTVTVSGEGNLRKVKITPFSELDGARVYEPRVNDAVTSQAGRLVGERRWEVLILPQKEGTLEIPPVELHYFDPVAKEYRSRQTEALKVDVTGRAASADAVGDDEPVDGQTETSHPSIGPLHLIRRHAALTSGATAVYDSWWFLALLIAVPIGFVALIVVQRVRTYRDATRDVIRSRRAAQVARRALEEASKDGEEGGESGLSRVMKAVNEFFAHRFGRSVAGMTMDELRTFLLESGAEEALADRAVDLVDQCERARFAGEVGGGEGAAKIAKEAIELIGELDRLSNGASGGGGGS